MKISTTLIDGVESTLSSDADWRSALGELLRREKAHMKASDELAAVRRQLPWIKLSKDYKFEGPDGSMSFSTLFNGRRQLIVYHHMLKPNDSSPCSGCSMVADQIPHLEHLHQRDTSLVFVSSAPYVEISQFADRMGWTFPWYSTIDNFNADFDITTGFGVNVFYRGDEGDIYRTYFTTDRAVETLGTIWTFLDLTPMGRQESWERSPKGTTQTAPFGWWRLHDEY